MNSSEKYVKVSQIDILLETLPLEENPTVLINIILNKNLLQHNPISDRLNKISELLRTDHLNEEEKSSLVDVFHEFNDLFFIDGNKLTNTRGYARNS